MQLNFGGSIQPPSHEHTDGYQTENTIASTTVQQSRSYHVDYNRSVERSEISVQPSQNQEETPNMQRSNRHNMNINDTFDNTLDGEIKTIPAHSLIFMQNQLKIEKFKKNLPHVRKQQRTSSIQKSEVISNLRMFSPNSFNENQDDSSQVMAPQNLNQSFITSPTFKSFTRLEPIKKDTNKNGNLDKIYSRYKERSYALQFQKDHFKVLKNAEKDIILLNDMFLTDSSLGQSTNPATLIMLIENALLKLQEQKSWIRNKINIDDQINEASFVFRRLIHAINEKSSTDCQCTKNFDLFAVALSMLWNFIVTSVDIILFKQQDEINEFKVKEEEMVEQKVALFRSKFEQKIYGLNCLIDELRQQVATLQEKNQHKKDEIHTLKHKLQQETELIQSFKDPEGMSQFRVVLQDMEKDIKYLAKEKELQYKSMRQSLRLMEDMTSQRNDVILNEQMRNQARDLQINEFKRQIQHLQSKMEDLEEQATKNQNALVWVSRPKRPAKKQAEILEAQKQNLTELQLLINKSGLSQDELDAMRMQMLQEVEEQVSWETEMRLREEFQFYLKRVLQNQGKKGKEKSKSKDQQDLSQLVDSFFEMNNTDLKSLRTIQKERSKNKQKGYRQANSKSPRANSEQSEEEDEDGEKGSDASILKKRKRSRNKRSPTQLSQLSSQNNQVSEQDYSDNGDSDFSDTLSVDIKKKKKSHQKLAEEIPKVDESINQSSFMMLKVLGIEKLEGRMKKGEVRLEKVKSKIDNATGAQRQVVKIKPDENPIIAAIAQALNLGKQKLTPEHFICMVPAQIWSIMDQMMQDKVYFDLENENGPVSERAPVSFPSFMYDTMLMQYGLYQISIKMLMQLTNGLKTVHIKEPFGFMLNQVLGLADQKLRIDEVQIIIRAHTFFKLIQSSWIQKTRKNYKYLEITDQNESNFLNGGDCLIFDILQGISSAFSSLPDVKDKIASTLKPDNLLKKNPDKHQQQLEFTILKITNKIAKIGKDVKMIYNEWDKDGNQLLEPSEVLMGIKKNLNISLTRDEANQFINYIDADKSGQIDLEEFTSKINFKDYQKRSHVYLISEKTFIEQILNVWYEYRAVEKEKLGQFILTFDDNGDRIIQFDEFQNLMQNLEPKITDQKIVSLYKKTLLIANKKEGEGLNDEICFKTLADVIMLYKLGGYGKEFFGTYLESKRSVYKELKKNKKK